MSLVGYIKKGKSKKTFPTFVSQLLPFTFALFHALFK